MTRILLVDDSPHAQRMGERILSDEGYEVVTVSNADSALIRLDDVAPDVVLADTVMPGRTGYEICQYVKMHPRHRHVRVLLTAGVLEPLDEAHAQRVEADGTLKKPFEASALLAAVKPLAEAASQARAQAAAGVPDVAAAPRQSPATEAAPFIAVVDAEQVRAAVTIALDAAMGAMVDEITHRVLAALDTKKSAEIAPPSAAEPPQTPAAPRVEAMRRLTPLRLRSAMLGLEISRPGPEAPSGSAASE
jgi:CheY-like chemotaxis protein